MGIFLTTIMGQNKLADCNARGVTFLVEIDLAETIEGVQISNSQTFTVKNCPFLVQILFQKVFLIEANCSLVLRYGTR